MKFKIKDKGLTLLELIISLAILSIIIIPISSMALSATKVNIESEDKLKAVALAQEIMEYAKDPDHTIGDINSKINDINDINTRYRVDRTIQSVGDKISNEDFLVNIEINKDNIISFSEKVGGNYNSDTKRGIVDSTPFNIQLHDQGNKKVRLEFFQAGNKGFGKIDDNDTTNNKVIIGIKLNGDNPEEINLDNIGDKKTLIVYIPQDSMDKVKLNVSGNVKINPEGGRLNRIEIKVFKKGETDKLLQIIEGYKIINN